MRKLFYVILITFVVSLSCKKDRGKKETEKLGPLSFKLKSINGEIVNLEDFKGNYVLIDFWASWCPPCKQAIPYITKFFNEYAGKGFYVIGIGLEEEGPLFNYSRANNIPYLILKGNNEIAKYYDVKAIPTLVLLDTEGNIIYRHVGFSVEEMIKLEGVIKGITSRLQ